MIGTPLCTHSELPDLIQHHVQHDEFLWFPGLASSLTRSAQEAMPGIALGYSTSAWLNEAVVRPRLMDPDRECRLGGHPLQVEALSTEHQLLFSDLRFRNEEDIPILLHQAIEMLNGIPSLAAAVGQLVQSLHLLAAPRSYDVSRSIPSLPFSIFVSVPKVDEPNGTLRLAESIVHEAMHLQLSLIERCLPIVEAGGNEHAMSPWQSRERPVPGLLHGLYVFAVISQVIGILGTELPDSGPYIRARQNQILAEVASLPTCPASLSPLGRRLWLRALDVVQER